MIDRKRLEEESEKYSFYELIYMVSQKCGYQQETYGCRGCPYMNCHDECCLCEIDESKNPSDWKDIEVEEEDEEYDDYWD